MTDGQHCAAATVNGVSAVSCPTAQQCTVVDGTGNELTPYPASVRLVR